MRLRQYQIDLSEKGVKILRSKNIVYLSMEVRTGKTLTSLEIAKLYNAKKVLFLTKKKAISSILDDYNSFGYADNFELEVINDESMNKVIGNFDLVIHDEHHRFGAFPKAGKYTKEFAHRFSRLPMIFLSGTPTPESFSQIYHQFWVSNYTPFDEINFYKWASNYVNVKQKRVSYGLFNDYSDANVELINDKIKDYLITFTQKEAGFETEVKENILYCEMKPITYQLIDRLSKDLVIEGKEETILGDTAVKLMSKFHQMYSGTIKFESGNTLIIDNNKALFIKDKFKGNKIAIFYKFKAELELLQNTFKDELTTDLDEFNNTNKSIAYQIVSGREGVNLSKAKYLIYFNIDFSATSYFQSRARLMTKDRLSNEVFWIFSKGGIEQNIYKVVKNKKKYTSNYFKKDYARINYPK
ncbi:hypothetical protein UFOVP104_36 [uncultured Caudovirales phage]|uniref:Helicase/UvrB N-terminal domain-containing protein n=1 Tax=uncultured Caudovirales phage TaxID=2100421 RepID=A0A6J5L247_9CAUD|nr:hypothetical protein UFOVP104_36 [uncultured Caudovirales phage]CAB4134094.1 hypothetical protein UFOVP271_16 [uncultured Caudovirales phage]